MQFSAKGEKGDTKYSKEVKFDVGHHWGPERNMDLLGKAKYGFICYHWLDLTNYCILFLFASLWDNVKPVKNFMTSS